MSASEKEIQLKGKVQSILDGLNNISAVDLINTAAVLHEYAKAEMKEEALIKLLPKNVGQVLADMQAVYTEAFNQELKKHAKDPNQITKNDLANVGGEDVTDRILSSMTSDGDSFPQKALANLAIIQDIFEPTIHGEFKTRINSFDQAATAKMSVLTGVQAKIEAVNKQIIEVEDKIKKEINPAELGARGAKLSKEMNTYHDAEKLEKLTKELQDVQSKKKDKDDDALVLKETRIQKDIVAENNKIKDDQKLATLKVQHAEIKKQLEGITARMESETAALRAQSKNVANGFKQAADAEKAKIQQQIADKKVEILLDATLEHQKYLGQQGASEHEKKVVGQLVRDLKKDGTSQEKLSAFKHNYNADCSQFVNQRKASEESSKFAKIVVSILAGISVFGLIAIPFIWSKSATQKRAENAEKKVDTMAKRF